MTLASDVQALRREVAEALSQLEKVRSTTERHEEQINGQRGLSAAIDALAVEVRSLRKAMYWVAGLIVAGSIGFAFGVLQLVG